MFLHFHFKDSLCFLYTVLESHHLAFPPFLKKLFTVFCFLLVFAKLSLRDKCKKKKCDRSESVLS